MSHEIGPNPPDRLEEITTLDGPTLRWVEGIIAQELEKERGRSCDPVIAEQIAQLNAIKDNPDSTPRERSMAYSGLMRLFQAKTEPPNALVKILDQIDLHGDE